MVERIVASRDAAETSARAAPGSAVIFDWAYTLFEPRGGVAEWFLDAAGSLGRALEPSTAEALGRAFEDANLAHEQRDARCERDLSAEAHRRFFADVCGDVPGVDGELEDALYAELPQYWRPYPDAAPVLRALKEGGMAIGVLSNVGYDIRPLFAEHDLDELVDTILLSFEHRLVKPDPALFELMLAALAVEPADALMVGDTPLTDGGAVHAGIATYLLPRVAPGSARGLALTLDRLRTRR